MGWDKGVDFEYAYNRILRHLASSSRSSSRRVSHCYDAVLLVQLRNGSRVSEAVKAFREFLRTRALEVHVGVSKRRNGETRLVVVPRELLDVDLSSCYELLDIDEKRLVNRVKKYAITTYRFNTHSLRYAFITYLLRSGISVGIVGKITKHKNLNHLLTYVQQREAERILRDLNLRCLIE